MSFAFKRFNFFAQGEPASHGFPRNATCHTTGGGYLFVACDNGMVHALDESFEQVTGFPAHGHKVLEVLWLESRRMLLTLGVEEPGFSSATLKLWEWDKLANRGTGAPTTSSSPAVAPLKMVKLFTPKCPESDVTAVAVREGMAGTVTVAVGLGSGFVYLITGELTGKGKLAHSGKLNARPERGDLWTVNGLELQGDAELLSLFVVTESQTLSFNLQSSAKTILDQAGSRLPHCCTLKGGLLVVARDEGLYDYTLDTRAGCTVYEGSKTGLARLRRFLVVVTSETNEAGASTRTVTIVDVRNRLVAGSATHADVLRVAVAFGVVILLLGNGRLLTLREVDLGLQLDSLFKRSLYKLALDVARAQGVDAATEASIHQRWGDHLYSKGEYDASMGQYLDTTGQLEPSYVIRRFLDAQRIHNLTAYLEALHERGLASADHTTLLLNCYTKLKDVEKLDRFIHTEQPTLADSPPSSAAHAGVGISNGGGSSNGSSAPGVGGSSAATAGVAVGGSTGKGHRRAGLAAGGAAADGKTAGRAGAGAGAGTGTGAGAGKRAELKFDAETAVKVLRGAGYHPQALWVAHQADQPDWMLDIMLDDMGSYSQAVQFLIEVEAQSRKQCAELLRKYGKALITHRPVETTRLLGELCTAGTDAENSGYCGSVADFAHLYCDQPTDLMLLCEFILNSSSEPANERLLYHTLLELYLAGQLYNDLPPASGGSGGTTSASSAAQPPRHPDKALELLQGGWPSHLSSPRYDSDHALLLCRLHDFSPGLVFLYDKLRLPREVLQVYMSTGDADALIASTIKYGDAAKGGDPALWGEVLEYFVSQPGDCTPQVTRVLDYVERGGLLPPLVVLQTLAKNSQLQMQVVRKYVANQLQRDSAEVATDRELIARLGGETAALRAEVKKLKTQARVFQNSRCAATGQPLDPPVVHFLCGHSFNLRSLGESESECPLCAPEFRRVLDIRRNMQAAGLHQDRFFTELRESADGFAVVAEHFGRGLMNMTGAAAGVTGGAVVPTGL